MRRGPRLGGHSNTVRVDAEGRAALDRHRLHRLQRPQLPQLRSAARRARRRHPALPHGLLGLRRAGGFEYSGTPLGPLRPARAPAQPLVPGGCCGDWRRFNREAPGADRDERHRPLARAAGWSEKGFSKQFIERLIVPQASAVWSADPEQMWSFPASFMAEFFDNHGMYSLRDRPRWRTVSGGSRSYVEAISAPWRDRVRLRAPVRRIERLAGRVRIEAEGCESEDFDEVVIADPLRPGAGAARPTPASRARDPRRDPLPAQRSGAAHRHLAAAAPARGLVELELPPQPASRPARTTVTYWMNNLQRLRRRARVPAHPQPRRGDRPRRRCSRRFSTSTPSTPRRASPRRRATREISGGAAAPTTAAPTGAGGSTRTGWSALRVCEASRAESAPARGERPWLRTGGARGVSASAVYEGTGSATGASSRSSTAFGYRLFLMYLDLDELPGCSTPIRSSRPAAPAPARFRRGDFMGDPERPLAECARDAVEAETGPVRAARCGCSPACATSATASTRSASTTALTRPGSG